MKSSFVLLLVVVLLSGCASFYSMEPPAHFRSTLHHVYE